MPGDVYRVAFPRTDLSVTVGAVKVKAGLRARQLGGVQGAWRLGAVAHGDLVLTDSEINPVISALQQHNFEITALHNHLINESPVGDVPALLGARRRRDAWPRASGTRSSKTKTPIDCAGGARRDDRQPADDLPAEQIQQAIGLKGTVTNGVLGLSQPRPETIQMMGVTLPPSMGMATAINFQSAGGGKVAATGDFVMIADEVNHVARALRAARHRHHRAAQSHAARHRPSCTSCTSGQRATRRSLRRG